MFDKRNADRTIQGQATHTATRNTNRGLMMTKPTTTIEIYATPAGGFALTQSGNGPRWPLSSFGPCDGFATREEAEQRKSDIETGRWQDASKRIAVGFSPIS